ncbi:protein FAM83B-like [Cebidichthys violaceus]|uniref:protein FAM83B-like n=1 Tax=Cebidichthys violaceus TaxID=271503 RepID=UPI0035CCA66B
MESNLSCLSSLKEDNSPVYVQPHYKESYRLAIYALLCGGKEAYEEFLRAEQISHFLSEEEILFIFDNAELPVAEEEDDPSEGKRVTGEAVPSTYFPTESDEEVPDLELGWPEVSLESEDTSISLLFNPPRQNTPTIKEVIRKQIQEARQVIAIAMDVFTDVDIFKEIVTATLRGVVVYILLDDSQFKSFLTMTQKVGINVQDLKNIRVRTVLGQQYQCQSGVKFRGDLEQRFLLVDCRTVLYGTYSYTWSFEKINLSMALVITGQLVGSYDEEFRRLYARSTVPTILSRERLSVKYLRDTVALQSPKSSQLALHQLHMRPRVTHGMRGAQDDRFNNSGVMTRGLSVQERLHQSHCFDMGNLLRGHSYGGELQKLSSLTRLRIGTKDIGVPFAPEKTGPNPRGGGGGDMLLPNRLSQHHLRHQTRYGADQNLIPFNSETSLHRWKMDAYFNDSDVPLDASCDAITPMTSPYSSHTGLNEHQSQLIHNRSRDIKSRMEEMRQKRLSLQDYNNLRHSQESLRSAYQTQERPKYKWGLDMRQSVAELEPNAQNGYSVEPANHKDSEPNKEVDKREQTHTDGQRSASYYDVAMAPDRRTTQTYDWHEPLSRTTSAADFEMTLNDPSLKLSHLQPSGLQHPRAMESLTEIPEEKGEGSRVNSSDSAAFKDGCEEICKDEKVVPKENSVESSVPAESQPKGQAGGSLGPPGKAANSSGSAAPRERKKSTSNEVQTAPKIVNPSAGSQHSLEAKSGQTEKKKAQPQEPPLQRKNSLRMKVSSMLSQDEKKAHKKDEKSLQRKASLRSLRSLSSSGSSQARRADQSQSPGAEQTTKKGQSPSTSRSQSSLSGPSETEKHKSPFPRLSPKRSSKKKPSPAGEQERGSRSALDDEGATVHPRKEKVYSRFEYLLNAESLPLDKSSASPPERDGRSSLNRHDSMYQTQSATDNKLGRFMQRVGNLIGKNK